MARSLTATQYRRLKNFYRGFLDTGRIGERVAARFLKQKGFTILKTNHRCKDGEVDIIAAKAGALHFIEVKTRNANVAQLFSGLAAIDLEKCRHIESAARDYLRRSRHPIKRLYFDAVIVTAHRQRYFRTYRAEYVKNVF